MEKGQGVDAERRRLVESLRQLVSEITRGFMANTACCQGQEGEDFPASLRGCQQP